MIGPASMQQHYITPLIAISDRFVSPKISPADDSFTKAVDMPDRQLQGAVAAPAAHAGISQNEATVDAD